jgi:hypothetical protein
MSLQRVRKRDGREVPFDESKIRDAIQRAMLAVGEGDLGFAGEVAGVVRLSLQNRRVVESEEEVGESSTPGIEEIQDLVEHALIELGRASVAKAYILYRDRRAKVREVLEVHRSPTPGARAPRVRTTEAGAAAAWSKGRIVAALMNEAELARATAEVIAGRVEDRVFALGIKRISTALVRELVDNELVGMGLEAALRRQSSVLLPVHDLRAQLQQPARPLDGSRMALADELQESASTRRISADVLRRFSVEHVLDDAGAERHLAGDLHVHDLGAPQLYLWAGLPSELFASGEFDEHSAFAALGECARALSSVSQGVVIEGAAELLSALIRTRGARKTEPLTHWLRAAAALSAASGRRIDLELGPERGQELIDHCLEALGQLGDDPCAARLFVDELALENVCSSRRDHAAQSQALERLLERGQLVPTWGRENERLVAPGCLRAGRERAAIYCAGAVAINLPRLALRAGPWREERMLESLAQAVVESIDALERLQAFQAGTRGSRQGELRGRIMYALTPVGLREALQVLGDGEIRPEQGSRLLGLLHDAARRLGSARGMSVATSAFFGERAGMRFAELDGGLPQLHQRLLFGESARTDLGRPYSSGWRLSPAPGFVPWAAEAQLLATLPVGALHPLPEDRSRGGLLSMAESLIRFYRLRREPQVHATPESDAAREQRASRERVSLFDIEPSAPVELSPRTRVSPNP